MFEVTETPVPIIRRREDAATVHVVKGLTRFLVHGREVNGAYAIIEQVIPPLEGPPLHVHRHETEIFYVVDGQFEIHVGGRAVETPPGASAVCTRDIPHTFRNVSGAPVRLLVTIVPGRFGEYFERVDSVDPNARTTMGPSGGWPPRTTLRSSAREAEAGPLLKRAIAIDESILRNIL